MKSCGRLYLWNKWFRFQIRRNVSPVQCDKKCFWKETTKMFQKSHQKRIILLGRAVSNNWRFDICLNKVSSLYLLVWYIFFPYMAKFLPIWSHCMFRSIVLANSFCFKFSLDTLWCGHSLTRSEPCNRLKCRCLVFEKVLGDIFFVLHTYI
jgi:hypothetical protein